MKLKALLPLVVWLLAALTASGQTDALLTQYFEVPTYYNAGAAGTGGMLRVRGVSRLQWVGIDNAPRTFLAVAESPFNLLGRGMGGGLWISQERMGLYDNLNVALQLSIRLKLAGGVLSVGLQPGMINQKFRGSEVFIPDDDDYHEETDEAIPRTDISGSAFDFGAGLHYSRRGFYVGVSATHLTSPTVTFSGSTSASQDGESGSGNFEFRARRTLYLTSGGNIRLRNPLFELMPSMLVASDFTYTRVIATARMRYRKILSFGAGYRHDDAVSLMIGAEYKGFFLGYSFDYPLTEISRASHGSHEVTAGYALKLDLSDKNRFKQKSIRIM